jgi:bacterioferritin
MDILNESIARELAVAIQYMWQHVLAEGISSIPVAELFKEVAVQEMKHAERFAERLNYFDGVPTTKPTEIKLAKGLTKMLEDDMAAEEEAIKLYKQAIKLAIELNDPVTRLLYEEILGDEEDHWDKFRTLLEKAAKVDLI